MKQIALIAALLVILPRIAAAQEEASPSLNAASAYMDAVFPKQCHDRADLKASGSRLDDRQYDFNYRDARLDDSEADFTFHLFQMHCYQGAYNSGSVFLKQDETGDFSVITFAVPYYTLDYVESSMGSKMRRPPHVVGFRTDAILENATFDPSTKSIEARRSWRGVGDAWDKGNWIEMEGNFVMTRFEIDPTYDSETGSPPSHPQSYVIVGKK